MNPLICHERVRPGLDGDPVWDSTLDPAGTAILMRRDESQPLGPRVHRYVPRNSTYKYLDISLLVTEAVLMDSADPDPTCWRLPC